MPVEPRERLRALSRYPRVVIVVKTLPVGQFVAAHELNQLIDENSGAPDDGPAAADLGVT